MKFTISFVTCIVMLVLTTSTSHAVPAFSRAHKVECTTCHTIAPELNEYGDVFLKNSYVYSGKKDKANSKESMEALPATASTPGTALTIRGEGDVDKLDKLKVGALGADRAEPPTAVNTPATATSNRSETKNEGLRLAAIPESIPISFTGSINYSTGDNHSKASTGGTNVDFAARSIKLHAAGNFRDTVGFFATYVAYSEQPPVGTYNTSVNPTNNKTDINEFFVQWRNALGTPVNLKIGRMQPKLGLWKTNNKLSATNNYLPYSYTVGQESVFRIEQPQDALELNTIIDGRLFLAAGLVNRKGQDNKEGYGHISYKFGGADYLGNEPDVDLFKEESILDYLTVTIGTYGYYGKNGPSTSDSPRNIFGRVGLDMELQYKIFRLRTLGGWGIDDNAAPSQLTYWPTVISKSATIEGEFTLLTNLITAGRFEYLQEVGGNPAIFNDLYLRRYVATLAYTPLENFKLATEFKYEIAQTGINRIGTLGASFSF